MSGEQLCTHMHRDLACGHAEDRHEVDQQGRSWCVPCWGSDCDGCGYHAFTTAAPVTA
jgi:hypothetical protein